jgi:hypothetical protein
MSSEPDSLRWNLFAGYGTCVSEVAFTVEGAQDVHAICFRKTIAYITPFGKLRDEPSFVDRYVEAGVLDPVGPRLILASHLWQLLPMNIVRAHFRHPDVSV